MSKLDDYRNKIDDIDSKIKELFIERMNIVSKVIEYKMDNNLPVFDSNRENDMFDNISISDEYKEYYIKLLRTIVELSKEYQRTKLK